MQGVQLKEATIVILETFEFKEKFKGGTFSYFSFIFNQISNQNVCKWQPFSNMAADIKIP